MIELIKVLVERLLSWPVAVFVLCLIFRKPLTSFITRIVLLKAPGVELSAPARADQQLVQDNNASTKDQLAQPVVVQQNLPIHEDIQKRQLAVRNYGGQEAIVLEQMEIIRKQLGELQFPLDSEDTANVLIRHLAVTQLLVRLERTYRLVFGSQIGLLQLLNHSGPQDQETAKSIFERARSVAPQFYGEYTFEQWMNFLCQQGAMLMEDGIVKITVYGTHFLEWIVAAQASPKPN